MFILEFRKKKIEVMELSPIIFRYNDVMGNSLIFSSASALTLHCGETYREIGFHFQ